MSKINAISNIIQKISNDDLPKNLKPYEFIFAFDIKKKKIVEAPKGIKKRFSFTAIDYYLLNQNSTIDITFSDFPTKGGDGVELDLSVKLNLELKDGLSKDGLKAPIEKFISEGKSYSNYEQLLRDVIRMKIKSFVKNYSQSNPNTFVEDFFKAKKKLEGEIAGQLENYGLDGHIKITSKNETQIPRILEFEKRIEVRVKDLGKLLHIKYKIEALLDSNKKNLALQSFGKENDINTKIEIALKEFIGNYSYKDFLDEREDKIIVPFKSKELTQILANFGRKVNYFQIEHDKGSTLEITSETFEETVECKIIGYNKPIKVENYVMLAIKDPAKYEKANIEDLNKWIRENIQKVTKRLLFGESYSSIVLHDSRIEEAIKENLHEICIESGLEVDQHVVTPDLPPLKIKKEGFDIESNRIYSTKSSSVSIEIKLVLSGKIPDLEKIPDYINPNIDISEEIKKTAEKATKRILHRTQPHAAFMYFDLLPEGESIYEDCPNCHVRERIRIEITKELEGFFISKLDVNPSINETGPVEKVTILKRGVNKLEMEIKPWNGNEDAERVNFHIHYQIEGVNPNYWDKFQTYLSSEEAEIYESIDETLIGDFKSKLPTLPMEYLRFRDFNTLKEVKSKVIDPVTVKIASVTGLNVQIVNFYRDTTQWEELNIADTEHLGSTLQQSNRDALAISHNARLKELNVLNKRKIDLIQDNEDGDNDDAIADINKKIIEITEEIPNFQISKGKRHLKKLKSPEKKDFSLGYFKELPENKNTEEE
ncbi:SPFH domain-containing protein [Hyunsoonleella pacifica]|uniref:Uncharacterized protein n=1 Tax=Hyunsoonleella pacifica TaxID=1080224 RepID=A0A4Q9FS09_9FLAO|nr:hypothetical protein [Hyunsoonleella pacifica]TBN18844.1 hypothetical protein EYD46_01910 [Hyunsoonleella pacifica]GGD05253.1 hypothetical protein GCM10011368_03820 [Hyunsoonleella pacifica]